MAVGLAHGRLAHGRLTHGRLHLRGDEAANLGGAVGGIVRGLAVGRHRRLGTALGEVGRGRAGGGGDVGRRASGRARACGRDDGRICWRGRRRGLLGRLATKA